MKLDRRGSSSTSANLPGWPRTDDVASPCLTLLICRMGIITLTP